MSNAGRNSVPLQKTILQMDLSKGLDESVRAEVAADQSRVITTLENLVQDKDGSWSLRPGYNAFVSSTTDETGASIGTPNRLYQTSNGVAMSNTDGSLYQYSDASGALMRKGRISEFSLEAAYAATAQQVIHSATADYAAVLATASSTEYVAVIYENGYNDGAGYSATLCIFDKWAGVQVRRYTLAPVAGTGATVRPKYVMQLVDNSYLHIYTWNQAGGNVHIAEVGPLGAWPVSGTTVTFSSLGIATAAVHDVATYGQWSICCLGAAGAVAYPIGGGAVTRAGNWHSVDIDNNGIAWLMGIDGGTGRLLVTGVTYTNIAGAATYSWVDPVYTPTTLLIGAASAAGVLSIVDTGTSAFGGTTIPRCTLLTTASAASTSVTNRGSIYGWEAASKPFYLDNNGKCYLHLNKSSILSDVPDITTHVLACLDTSDIVTSYYSSVNKTRLWRVAAVLEPYNGARAVSQPRPQGVARYTTADSTDIAIPFLGSPRASAIALYRLTMCKVGAQQNNNGALFAGNTYIAGGAVSLHDGTRAAESGIVDEPIMTGQIAAGPGQTGIYNYVSVFRAIDANGNVAFSKTYGPYSLTLANQVVNFTVQNPHLTSKDIGINGDWQVVTEIFRTLAGGTQYYLLASSRGGTTPAVSYAGDFMTFQDNVSDATLATNALMYRQPGTIGTALDRYVPPGGYGVICSHKDRLFVASPFGNRVYYSSFFLDGEQPWFNAQFSFQVHGGSGPITAMASLDGRLVIFRRDAIFVVDGDGPPENGGNGAEFTPATRVAGEIGCIDPRSVVNTPMGIMYRSLRGIELLTRSMQIVFIGERVIDTCNSNPDTRAALLHDGRVYFFLCQDDTSTTTSGVCCLYDLTNDCWSTAKHTFQSTYGRAVRGATIWETNDNETRLVIIPGDGTQPIFVQDNGGSPANGDNGTATPWTIETGWLRPAGNLGRFRLHDIMFLGKRVHNSGNTVTVNAAYDYESYSQAFTFGPTSLSKTLVDVSLQPKAGSTQPVCFKTKVTSPSYGIDVLGLCFMISIKDGAYRMAEFKKG